MKKINTNNPKPLTEGQVKNNQSKPESDIQKEAILKPPAAKPKKKKK